MAIYGTIKAMLKSERETDTGTRGVSGDQPEQGLKKKEKNEKHLPAALFV